MEPWPHVASLQCQSVWSSCRLYPSRQTSIKMTAFLLQCNNCVAELLLSSGKEPDSSSCCLCASMKAEAASYRWWWVKVDEPLLFFLIPVLHIHDLRRMNPLRLSTKDISLYLIDKLPWSFLSVRRVRDRTLWTLIILLSFLQRRPQDYYNHKALRHFHKMGLMNFGGSGGS